MTIGIFAYLIFRMIEHLLWRLFLMLIVIGCVAYVCWPLITLAVHAHS